MENNELFNQVVKQHTGDILLRRKLLSKETDNTSSMSFDSLGLVGIGLNLLTKNGPKLPEIDIKLTEGEETDIKDIVSKYKDDYVMLYINIKSWSLNISMDLIEDLSKSKDIEAKVSNLVNEGILGSLFGNVISIFSKDQEFKNKLKFDILKLVDRYKSYLKEKEEERERDERNKNNPFYYKNNIPGNSTDEEIKRLHRKLDYMYMFMMDRFNIIEERVINRNDELRDMIADHEQAFQDLRTAAQDIHEYYK